MAHASTVLIISAGPAGLFAACELLRHGVPVRILDRRTAPHRETRGTAMQPAALASLARAGIVDRVLQAGQRIRHIQVLGAGMRELVLHDFGEAGGRYPFRCSLPQWRTEAILREHLAALGGAVEYGIEATAVETAADGVRVALRGEGGTEEVGCAYVIGAGGGHSVTRHAMREQLAGETYEGRYLVADLRIRLPCPPECGRLILGPTGLVLLSPLPEERWLVFVNRDPEETGEDPPGEAALGTLLDARAGADLGAHDLRWVSPFRMHRRMVGRVGDGRRFLIGDAAHLPSPLGGEGINSALMDAADIAWKMALVLQGAAKPALLDSYAIERGLADRHVLEVSDEVHGDVMGLVALYAGGGVPEIAQETPAQRIAGTRRRLMLDVSYAGSGLIGATGDGWGEPAPGQRLPACHLLTGTGHHLLVFGAPPPLDGLRARWGERVRILDGAEQGFDAAASGVAQGGAVLVRPDGIIGLRASPLDAEGIAALDTHLSGYLLPAA